MATWLAIDGAVNRRHDASRAACTSRASTIAQYGGNPFRAWRLTANANRTRPMSGTSTVELCELAAIAADGRRSMTAAMYDPGIVPSSTSGNRSRSALAARSLTSSWSLMGCSLATEPCRNSDRRTRFGSGNGALGERLGCVNVRYCRPLQPSGTSECVFQRSWTAARADRRRRFNEIVDGRGRACGRGPGAVGQVNSFTESPHPRAAAVMAGS